MYVIHEQDELSTQFLEWDKYFLLLKPAYTVLPLAEYVVRFEVSVSDTVGVEKVECRGDLLNHAAGLSLCEPLSLLDVFEKMATQHTLKHKTELSVILKEIDQV